jgi:hypothetical protein
VTKDAAQTQPFGFAQGREHVERQLDFLRSHHLLILAFARKPDFLYIKTSVDCRNGETSKY